MRNIAEDPGMKTLGASLYTLVQNGYSENFKVTSEGLMSLKTNKTYQPESIKVVDFYHFERNSEPANEAILFAIETTDGSKGTLVDSFNTSSDIKVTSLNNKWKYQKRKTHFKNV